MQQLQEKLEELQQQRQRQEADLSRQYMPSPVQQGRLKKVVQTLNATEAEWHAKKVKVQQQQDLVLQLAAQEKQLTASADTAQQRFAAEKVQAAADALLELSYAVHGLIRHTAGAVAPVAAVAAAGWAGAAGGPGSVGLPAHSQQLGLQMQLAEAVAKAGHAQQLEVSSQKKVEVAVQQLQVGAVVVSISADNSCRGCTPPRLTTVQAMLCTQHQYTPVTRHYPGRMRHGDYVIGGDCC
jgi:hypothetical protein